MESGRYKGIYLGMLMEIKSVKVIYLNFKF